MCGQFVQSCMCVVCVGRWNASVAAVDMLQVFMQGIGMPLSLSNYGFNSGF